MTAFRIPRYNGTPFRLGPRVFGLWLGWLCFCPWNGSEFWVQVPLVCFIAGTQHVELVLGHGRFTLYIDVRWRFS